MLWRGCDGGWFQGGSGWRRLSRWNLRVRGRDCGCGRHRGVSGEIRNGGHAGHGCTGRDIGHPESLPGIDRRGASHAVGTLQLRIGDVVGKGDAEERIAALDDMISYPAEWRSARNDRHCWNRWNV